MVRRQWSTFTVPLCPTNLRHMPSGVKILARMQGHVGEQKCLGFGEESWFRRYHGPGYLLKSVEVPCIKNSDEEERTLDLEFVPT